MDHFSHKHPLILNEDYIAREGDLCHACHEEVVSCKSFVFSCSRSIALGNPSANTSGVDEKCIKFLLHKTCAELPHRIKNPRNPQEILALHLSPHRENPSMFPPPTFGFPGYYIFRCSICRMRINWNYSNSDFQFAVCLKCAMSQVESLQNHKFNHPAHTQHPLALIQRPSLFKCDACNVAGNPKDMSYKCIDCPFWMHKSCADAPTSFLFQFHEKHPLILSFSMPEAYHKFRQCCRFCNQTIYLSSWLYYCSQCRFFAHFQCARSNRMLSFSEDKTYPNLVHLPAADESSINLLAENFIKEVSTLRNDEECSTSRIKDWAHSEHHLQLITIDQLNDQKDCDDRLLICDGCAKSIRNDGDLFYACVSCKYFLHKFCGDLPRMIPQSLPDTMLFAYKYSEPYKLFLCCGCGRNGSGISFCDNTTPFSKMLDSRAKLLFHIGCSTLPKMIKHESHRHPLHSKNKYGGCKACGSGFPLLLHSCEGCDFHICTGCIMKASRVKHRWDPHPLHLIYDPGMVTDHEHGFHCEFCSHELDTNFWFYHCNDCDLSFHLMCYEYSCYLYYSRIKFGATDIIINQFHPHGLTYVLSKKFRRCGKCDSGTIGEPVLECAPCKIIFCQRCCDKLLKSLSKRKLLNSV